MNYIELSKEVSYVLRHHPEQYDLQLDSDGWVDINVLIEALKKKKKWQLLSRDDIIEMIKVSNKKRHEIVGDNIRALYGHSTSKTIYKEKIEPPQFLYHGTARRFVESIMKNGLLPRERQYVHLSTDKQTACEVGKRRDDKPVLLKVMAKTAWDNGISFYIGNKNIWLSDSIPSEYIMADIEL